MDKKARNNIMIDMNEFLITYAATILTDTTNVSQVVFDTAQADLTDLDDLLDDNGFGRQEKFFAIGEGYLRDSENIADDELKVEADQLAHEAIAYLGEHINDFEHWRTE
ncbi:hypothetical protein [Lentilactobacillus kribbianus]|uniref:hypothetical protein n=1 Tax=Lentilactobacillus kribbianus TaxID=2729622 RepID=UPI001551ABAA|nr:hypothetical protein [Lentilactobacillus kribbianus]